MTKTFTSPLNPITHIVSRIPKEWKWFSVFDLVNGFYNIPLQTNIMKYFCFHFNKKKYQFKRLPMGWNVSALLFHSKIENILKETKAISYMDDLIIGGSTIEEHNTAVFQLMKQLNQYGLHINYEKSKQFCLPQVEFLGFTISKDTVGVDHYIQKVKEKLPVINSKKTLQSALGLMNPLHSFIPELYTLLKPFYNLTTGGAVEDWEKVNEKLHKMWSESLGRIFKLQRTGSENVKKETYTLYTDWSGHGAGFALFLNDALIWISSKRCKVWKRAVSSFLGELHTICSALKEISWIVRGQKLIIKTDSLSAQNKLMNKEHWVDKQDIRILRHMGWLLSNWDIGNDLKIEFVSGKENVLTDKLSRWKGYSSKNETLNNVDDRDKGIWLQYAHRVHFGKKKMKKRLEYEGIQWKNMAQDIEKYVDDCKACQACSKKKPLHNDLSKKIPEFPNHIVVMDYIGPMKTSRGNVKFILSMIDSLTKWVSLSKLKNRSAKNTVEAIKRWEHENGPISILMCDSDPVFFSKEVINHCKQ